jgi:phage-related protein
MLSILNNPKDQRRRSVRSFRSLAQEIVDDLEAALEQFRRSARSWMEKLWRVRKANVVEIERTGQKDDTACH